MPLATCPAPAELEQLCLGKVPEDQLAALEQHVQGCGACLEKLKAVLPAYDTLGDALAGQDTRVFTAAVPPLVDKLIRTLENIKLTTKPIQMPGVAMLTFACSACSKKLSVKAELAGKKVKCPSCRQLTVVPAAVAVAAAGHEDMRTVPPAAMPDLSTPPPAQAAPSEKPTNPPLSQPDATLGVKLETVPEGGPDTSLTEFLAPPQADDELGRLGKYRILKILGHGGMGVVYLAEDPKLMRRVAIKAMLPLMAASSQAGKRFLREAQAMAKVEHDHIVRIYQVDEDRGVPFLAMEFLKGEPLDERLKRPEPLALTEILRIGREIADALDAAHATGLIHRDIKPANIWLEAPRHRVKILDFGLARAASQAESGLTQQGAIIGTPAYMAPEQGRGGNVDARCDLFSLGVVLYRMGTGQQPYYGTDTVSTLMSVAMHDPLPPSKLNPELPTELSSLIMKLLEKDPDRRIATAAEVVQTLQSLEKKLALQKIATETTEALDAVPPELAAVTRKKSAPPRRRSPVGMLTALVAGLGALALLAGGIVYYFQTDHGVVRVEVNDPAIQFSMDKTGTTFKGVDNQDIKVSPGEHGLHIERGDLKFDTDKFILKKGETITLKVEWLKEGKLQVVQDGKVIGQKERPKVDMALAAPNYALSFDGVGHVELPRLNLDTRKPFMIEARVRLARPLTKGQFSILEGNGLHLAAEQFSLAAEQPPFKNPSVWKFYQGRWLASNADRALVAKRWVHLAAVCDGKDAYFFIDGRRQTNTLPHGYAAAKNPLPQTIWNIGLKPSGTMTGFPGEIDEVRVSNIARHTKDFATPGADDRYAADANTVALYHFDEGSGDVLKDSSGNGHHGKIVGAKWVKAEELAPAPSDYALSFSYGDKVTFADKPGVAKQGSYTYEGWFLLDDPSTKAAGGTRIRLVTLSRNMFVYNRTQGWGFDQDASTLKPLFSRVKNSGRWTHLAVTRGDREMRIFVDGVPAASSAANQNEPYDLELKSIQVGGTETKAKFRALRVSKVIRYVENFTPATRFQPDADTLALYHFDEGSGDVLKDSSGNGHDGKIVGAKWVKAAASPPTVPQDGFDKSFALGLEGGKIRFANPISDESTSCTLEGWCFVQNQQKGIAGLIGSGSMYLGVNADYKMYFYMPWGIPKGLHSKKSSVGRWMHLAGVSAGKNHRFFVDGQLVASEISEQEHKVSISLNVDPNSTIRREVRISKVARYDKDFTPQKHFEPDADTLALYHCDEGSGDVLKDSSGNGHHGKIVGAKWVKADGSPLPSLPPRADDWLKTVAAMSTAKQMDAVKTKLMELNPGFDGKMWHDIQGGKVTSLEFRSDNVADISPLRALVGLKTLKCSANDQGKARLADLSPLKGMQLTYLDIGRTKVADLSPLEGMPLTYLDIYIVPVRDLFPLKNMKLTVLRAKSVLATDLSPIKDMPLRELTWNVNLKSNYDLLRSIKTLETINGKSVAAFWKEVDAGASANPPLDAAWLKQVAAMPAEKQVEAVADKLKERNPGFDGKITSKIKKGVVTEVRFLTEEVTDISPVRALPGLTSLHCYAINAQQGKLADLSPLKGMSLSTLHCDNSKVADLSPLKGMTMLTDFSCQGTPLDDLSPLQGMKLTSLDIGDTPVADLSPLKGQMLKNLRCSSTNVANLSPLQGMPLVSLDCANTKVADLLQLKGLPLKELSIGSSPMADLSSLQGLPLQSLRIHNLPVADLSPLQGLPLQSLRINHVPVADLSPLKGMMSLTNFDCSHTKVTDLSPLKGLKLTKLSFSSTMASELGMLKGMPLRELFCYYTQVSDLSPLTGMKLTTLDCRLTKVTDLSPLKGMPLKAIRCDFKVERDADVLRSLKTLERINERPAAEFWKGVEQKELGKTP